MPAKNRAQREVRNARRPGLVRSASIDSVTLDDRSIRLHRTLLLGISGVYLAWWLFVRLSLPHAFNPLGGRVLAVTPFVLVWALSFRSTIVAKSLDLGLAICCCLATAHYFYLFDHNGPDLNWLVGSYITVTAVCAVLQTRRALLLYSGFIALVSLAMLGRPAEASYVVFLPGMLTNLLLFNIGLSTRLKLVARLEESNRLAAHEIVERKRAEAELQQSNRELESFSYSVAHDLRTPLRAMSGFAEVLQEDYGERLEPEAKSYLTRIADAAATMSQLIDALLGLARLTRKELRREDVDLSQLAEATAESLRANHPERSVAVEVEPGMRARGDAQLLRSLLDNLVTNAWKFTEKTEHAQIAVGISDASSGPVYFVKDNGAGFDMAHASKLFAPFQRLHAANEYPGTGIGLATVQRIVERHGGRVWAEGAVAAGASFFFTLSPAQDSSTQDGTA